MSLTYCDGYLPFCAKAADAWDGETFFTIAGTDYPSGASDSYIAVTGAQTRHPIGMTVEQVCKYYWQVKYFEASATVSLRRKFPEPSGSYVRFFLSPQDQNVQDFKRTSDPQGQGLLVCGQYPFSQETEEVLPMYAETEFVEPDEDPAGIGAGDAPISISMFNPIAGGSEVLFRDGLYYPSLSVFLFLVNDGGRIQSFAEDEEKEFSLTTSASFDGLTLPMRWYYSQEEIDDENEPEEIESFSLSIQVQEAF